MLHYRLKIHKNVKKFLLSATPKQKQQFKEKFDLLQEDPFHHSRLDIKPMQGADQVYRLRVGQYRLIYKVDTDELLIFLLTAGSRGDVYK